MPAVRGQYHGLRHYSHRATTLPVIYYLDITVICYNTYICRCKVLFRRVEVALLHKRAGTAALLALLALVALGWPLRAAWLHSAPPQGPTPASGVEVLFNASSLAVMEYAGVELPKLRALEEAWGGPYVLTHDFNLQGLSGWEGWLGDYGLAPVPGSLAISYHTPVRPKDNDGAIPAGRALLLHAERSAVVLAKRISGPLDLGYVRVLSYALATRLDCEGNVSVFTSFYYVAPSMGALASTGGLDYDSLLPYVIVNGSNWLLARPSGVLEIWSPLGDGGVVVWGVAAYKAPEGVYIVEGAPYRVSGEPVEALVKQANGGLHTVPARELDGLATAVVPGNPLLLTPTEPVRGALLLDLAPGYSRLPAVLELYRLEGGSWARLASTVVVPAEGRIGFLVEASPGDVFMLRSTVTVRVDRVYFAPVEPVDPQGLEALDAEVAGGRAVRVSYEAGDAGGAVLVFVNATVPGGPVVYAAAGGLTVYGGLWIANPDGAPSLDGCGWVTVSSDVVEVPGGGVVEEAGLLLVGYRYPGGPDSPLMVLYVKSLVYPVISSAGFPEGAYDVAYHTEAVVGVSKVLYQPGLDQYTIGVDVSALRTSAAGESYWGGPLRLPGVNVSAGRLHFEYSGGCRPPNDGDIDYFFGVNSEESTNPQGPGSYSGLAAALSAISILGGFASVVLSTAGPGAPATVVSLASLAAGLFSGVAEVMYGSTEAGLLQGVELVNLPCTHFDGIYIATRYGLRDGVTHAVMSYTGLYDVWAPSSHGILIGAIVFNHYVPGNPIASDDDAMVVLLYFIKPYGGG